MYKILVIRGNELLNVLDERGQVINWGRGEQINNIRSHQLEIPSEKKMILRSHQLIIRSNELIIRSHQLIINLNKLIICAHQLHFVLRSTF